MKPLSKAKKSRIIDLLFAGKTYREVATIEDVSTSTVSKVFQEFVSVAEDRSITEVAAEYNVRDRVDRLIELSREARKAKTPIPRLLSAVRLLSLMNSLDLRPSQLKSYLKMCVKHKGDFANFAAKATEFFELETKTGKPYERIVKEYSELTEKTASKREEIAELKKERRRAERGLEQDLANNKLVRRDIVYASTLKEKLAEYDFNVEDTYKIPRFLDEIEACGGDPQIFIKRAEEAETLDSEVRNLKDEKKSLQPLVESLRKERIKLQDAKEQLQNNIISLEGDKKKSQEKLDSLNAEAKGKSNEIRLAKCIIAILRSKPADFDALYNHLYIWKQIRKGVAPQWISRELYYEKEIRKIVVNTFLEYFEDDLAPKEELTKLKEEIQGTNQQNSSLLKENKDLRDEKEKLSGENDELEKRVERLEEELRECRDQIMRDPTIQPKDRKLPFSPY